MAATSLHVTHDLIDLPARSERLAPAPPVVGRPYGIDHKPDWSGRSGVEVAPESDANGRRSAHLLDRRSIRLEMPPDASAEQVREIRTASAGLRTGSEAAMLDIEAQMAIGRRIQAPEEALRTVTGKVEAAGNAEATIAMVGRPRRVVPGCSTKLEENHRRLFKSRSASAAD